VVNPFAHQLTFLSDKTRTRRDHMKYLTLIQSIALLHQYQREVKRTEHRGKVIEYIEVQKSDIALANKLAHEVLGRTLDEMPPQTRKLLLLIQSMVNEASQRQGVRPARCAHAAGYPGLQQLERQPAQEPLHAVAGNGIPAAAGGSRGHLLHYELLWDGSGKGDAHLCGLLEVDEAVGDGRKSDSDESKSASGRVRSALCLTLKKCPQARQSKGLRVCKSALTRMQ
jgi:hypothetical protein